MVGDYNNLVGLVEDSGRQLPVHNTRKHGWHGSEYTRKLTGYNCRVLRRGLAKLASIN
jgi:hypothetical protein